ncbi:MAG: hypothetical protein ACREF3_18445, partial [Acetobacteraceae bacterium]
AAALGAARRAPAASPAALPDVAGEWTVCVRFLHGERRHRLRLQQRGDAVTGTHASEQFEGGVSGFVRPDSLSLVLRSRYEGSDIEYRLDGVVMNGGLRGHVVLGTANDHHRGEVGLSQFGTAEWQAERA